ncbi:hypothetical protein GGR56DRAFT_669572 [Xylariaceae sp. FL0804]|nr:hypothetical protein GGR56DRAFT_669572 [Xylariaceae sp. FL0804]
MTTPWLIAVIVIGALIAAALISLAALFCVRSRRLRREIQVADAVAQRDLRIRKMSRNDRLRAEEMERDAMLRKSLASRSSASWSAASASARSSRVDPGPVPVVVMPGSAPPSVPVLPVAAEMQAGRMGVASQIPRAASCHDLSLRNHPALSSSTLALSIPDLPRVRSPSTDTFQLHRLSAPPTEPPSTESRQ